MKKNICADFGYCFFAVVLAAVIGFSALFAAYLIPVRMMTAECRESAAVLKKETTYTREEYSERQLDNWTDSIMLLEASYPGTESNLEKTINAHFNQMADKDPCESFVGIFSGPKQETENQTYPRYWHGYLVLLKPLLVKLNYMQIRTANRWLLYTCLLALLVIVIKRRSDCFIPFVITVLLLAPTAIASSLQYSSVFYIAIGISFVLTVRSGKLSFDGDDRVWRLFLLAGIMTSFFDLLTAPTVTLTIPLTFLCCFAAADADLKRALPVIIGCVFAWGIGYAGMWICKFLIAGIYNGSSFWRDIWQQFVFRTSASALSDVPVPRNATIAKNVRELFSNPHLLAITAIYAVMMTGRRLFRRTANGFQAGALHTVCFLIPMVIPLLWVIVLANHSEIHYWFTFRTIAPCVFSGLCALSVQKNTGRT